MKNTLILWLLKFLLISLELNIMLEKYYFFYFIFLKCKTKNKKVEYDISGFLEKNQHSLPQNLIDLYSSSSNFLVKALFIEKEEEVDLLSNMGTLRRGKKLLTVCSQFKVEIFFLKNLHILLKNFKITHKESIG